MAYNTVTNKGPNPPFPSGQYSYREIGILGSGAYGSVYKALDQNNETIALKKIRFSKVDDEISPVNLLREVSFLSQLKNVSHPNVIKLLQVSHEHYSSRITIRLAFEFMDQDLLHFIEKFPEPKLPESKIKDLMFQLLNGVEFLHSIKIIHRDIKPQNILISTNGTLKITDFGLARLYLPKRIYTTTVVTLWYRAPEILLNTDYGAAVDIWSCACIFAELFTKKGLFPGESEVFQLVKIFEIIGPPPKEQWPSNCQIQHRSFNIFTRKDFSEVIPGVTPEAKVLIESMLHFNPAQRPTALKLLKDSYFEGRKIIFEENSEKNQQINCRQPLSPKNVACSSGTSSNMYFANSTAHSSNFKQQNKVPEYLNCFKGANSISDGGDYTQSPNLRQRRVSSPHFFEEFCFPPSPAQTLEINTHLSPEFVIENSQNNSPLPNLNQQLVKDIMDEISSGKDSTNPSTSEADHCYSLNTPTAEDFEIRHTKKSSEHLQLELPEAKKPKLSSPIFALSSSESPVFDSPCTPTISNFGNQDKAGLSSDTHQFIEEFKKMAKFSVNLGLNSLEC